MRLKRMVISCLAVVTLLALCVGSMAAAPAKVKLTYWHFLGGDMGKRHETLIKEFNKANPDIEVESLYSGNAWTMRDKLLAAVAGKQPPDVSMIDQFWAAQLASTGAIIKMQTLIDGPDGIDRADVNKTAWMTATVDGEIWTMPYAMSNIVLYYNKDMFRAVGLDPNKPPTTWGELVDYAKKLTRDVNGDGKIDEWGLSFPIQAGTGTVYYYITFLWQAGGELYNADYTKVAFNSPAGVEALQFWMDLVYKHGVVPLAPPTEGFTVGRIAMELASSSTLETRQAKCKFPIGVAHIPAGKNKVTGVGGNNLAIFKNTSAKEAAAWKFVKWMSSPEMNLRWSTMTGYTPLRDSVVNSQGYKDYLKANPEVATMAGQMACARPRPNNETYPEVSRILGLAVEKALFSKADPKQLLDEAAVESDEYIKSIIGK
ncbi:MAG: ABC transporter substrate-binding protein [Firmicutes bacterium]|nr:ABC transporter substrate-binding protein [Bacillota bacterium]